MLVKNDAKQIQRRVEKMRYVCKVILIEAENYLSVVRIQKHRYMDGKCWYAMRGEATLTVVSRTVGQWTPGGRAKRNVVGDVM